MEEIKNLNLETALRELDVKIAIASQEIQAYGNRGGEGDLFNHVKEKLIKGFSDNSFTLEQAKSSIDEIMASRNER